MMRIWNIMWNGFNVPVEAPKIGSTTRGIPTQSRPWLAAPFPFDIVGPTGDIGLICRYVCVLRIDIS